MPFLKKFWEKKKSDFKFSKAGKGYRLNQDSKTLPSTTFQESHNTSTAESKPPSTNQAKNAAAEAAVKRSIISQEIQNRAVKLSSYKSYPLDLIKEEKEKMLKEKQEKIQTCSKEKLKNEADNFTFNCPALDLLDYLPLAQLKEQIEAKIRKDFAEDPVIMNALLILNCNEQNKSEQCLATLNLILTNLKISGVENFEKYRKVKKAKIEQKILSVKGGTEFLEGIGFKLNGENFYVYSVTSDDLEERLDYYLDILKSSERCSIELNRNVVVSDLVNLESNKEDYDENDLNLTVSELAREQQALKEIRESHEALMTSEMRNRLQPKKVVPQFTRLRLKIPKKAKMIETTFRTNETFNDFINWLISNFSNDNWDQYDYVFGTNLISQENYSKTLSELDLISFATIHLKKK